MKRYLQNVTIVFTVLYVVIAISGLIKRDYSLKISAYELELITAFLIFILGFICSFDYPLITGILFISWSISMWIIGPHIVVKTLATEILSTLMFFASFPVLLLGIFFIFNWWKVKSKW